MQGRVLSSLKLLGKMFASIVGKAFDDMVGFSYPANSR